jgi:hypothetical protein
MDTINNLHNLIAQANPFGKINAPPGVNKFSPNGVIATSTFLTILMRTLIVAAGVYAVFSFIIAGYTFMSAGGDSKKVEAAWARIWQTILGLAFAAGAFVLAGLIGLLLFRDVTALLQFRVFGI